MSEVDTILSVLALPTNYSITRYTEIVLRKLRDGTFCVSMNPLGRAENPPEEPSWEQVFVDAKVAVEYFIVKCEERYGE